MPDEPIFDFPVLSDEARSADPKPGVIETVWRFEDDWERGEELGEVHITEPGGKQFKAQFTFTNSSRPVTVTGDIPETDGRPWVGRGRGKAKSDAREKEIDIEGRNPKKWG